MLIKIATHFIAFGALLLACGCVTSSHLPSGAKVVGGGLQIDWEPPADGTAMLVETTTGKTVATHSVGNPGANFCFDVSRTSDAEVLAAIFPTMPSNAHFVLFFVPSPKKD